MPVVTNLITAEEFLAFPDDGVDRWLIRGQLREKTDSGDALVTIRNRWHSRIDGRLGQVLNNWLDSMPLPRGSVHTGEVGCKLQRDPDTIVGIDAVYISPEVAAKQGAKTTIIDGVPILAAEILSPSDKQEEIDEKVDEYLAAGVAVVWIIDPHDKTVLVYRPNADPELITLRQDLTAEPHLPGFRVAASKLFE